MLAIDSSIGLHDNRQKSCHRAIPGQADPAVRRTVLAPRNHEKISATKWGEKDPYEP